MESEVSQITLLVTQTLEQLDIPYAVGGSLASSIHGVMRSTLDVDIVADMRLEHIQPLVAALSKEFYADDEMMRDAVERHSSFNLIHYETAFKVDIFIRKLRTFDQMQLERRRTSMIATDPERSVYVTSPEDTILSKLEWYRMGGEVSDRQWRDILGDMKADGEEFQCAQLLDNHPKVKRWVRNLEGRPQHSFWLQTSTDRFYPDFVCELTDGRFLVVEYKGFDRWSDDDSTEKRSIGKVWEDKSDSKCLFIMPQGPDWNAILAKLK